MKMNGKKSNDFVDLFEAQKKNQIELLRSGKYKGFTDNILVEPEDDARLCSYHIQQLISEIGEVLEADKRWKNFRNDKYDRENKEEEVADCFIVLMNIAMFSGMSGEDLFESIKNKIKIVSERIK